MNSTQVSLDLEDNVRVAVVVLCTVLMLLIQMGFAMLEVGSVREGNRHSVLAKNVLDSAASALAVSVTCTICPPSIMQGQQGELLLYLVAWQWAFAATCVTICSGAMAERTHMVPYLLYAALMGGVVYPLLADSVWGTSPALLSSAFFSILDRCKYHDWAGGGLVHVAGGTAALVGNLFLGRRIMLPENLRLHYAKWQQPLDLLPQLLEHSPVRASPMTERASTEHQDFDEQEECELGREPEGGWPRRYDDHARDWEEFQGCTYLQVMGLFTLWVGFYAFNMSRALRSSSKIAALVAWNTTITAGASGFGSFIFLYAFRKTLDVGFICNGILGGLVASTAGCAAVQEGSACAVGLICGLVVYPLGTQVLLLLKIDDPVDATIVHGACGAFGVLAVGVSQPDCRLIRAEAAPGSDLLQLCDPSRNAWAQLFAQAQGLVVIIAVCVLVFSAFWALFAISERVQAQEAPFLDQADKILLQMVSSGSGEVMEQWREVAKRSFTAQRVMKQHGWSGDGFADGAPYDVYSLRSELQQALHKVQSSLETASRPVACLVRWASSCRILRAFAALRLRIPPVAELTGQGGNASLGDGQTMAVLRRAIQQLADMRRDEQRIQSPLQQEVRELNMLVQSQEILLRALARNLPRPSGFRPLQSVPEQEDQLFLPEHISREDMASFGAGSPQALGHSHHEPAAGPGLTLGLPTDRGLMELSPGPLSDTASTLSDSSAGLLSQGHSASSGTPPPMMYSRGPVRHPDRDMQGVVHQLVTSLQAQQQLMAALQQVGGPSQQQLLQVLTQAPSHSDMADQNSREPGSASSSQGTPLARRL